MSEWPQDRPYPFADLLPTNTTTGDQTGLKDGLDGGLGDAWRFSANRILDLRTALLPSLPQQIGCVAVSGSLARMEAHEGSDVDLLVVLDDRSNLVSAEESLQLYQLVWQRLLDSLPGCPLTPPKAGGVFSSCASWVRLTDPAARGIVNEDMTNYGQRMQVLLDAQPIFQNDEFCKLQASLLTWFSETRITAQFSEAGPFHWLSEEVRRYWHSIRARASWLFADEPLKSLEVNVKLRSSRMMLVAAFLHSLHESQLTKLSGGAAPLLLQWLQQTPLEIVTSVVSDNDTAGLLLNYQIAWKFCQAVESGALPKEVSDALKTVATVSQPLMEQRLAH